MKLTVRVVDVPLAEGGKAIVLCDESGEMLPMQTDCTVSNRFGERAKVVASFLIDGDLIRFVD